MKKMTDVPETVIPATDAGGDEAARNVRVRFDDTKMESNYANVANVGERVEVVVAHFGQVWRGSEGPAIRKVKRVTVRRYLADELRSHAAGGAWLGFDDDGLPQQWLEDTHERTRDSVRCAAGGVSQHHANGFVGVGGLRLRHGGKTQQKRTGLKEGASFHGCRFNERKLGFKVYPSARALVFGQGTQALNDAHIPSHHRLSARPLYNACLNSKTLGKTER